MRRQDEENAKHIHNPCQYMQQVQAARRICQRQNYPLFYLLNYMQAQWYIVIVMGQRTGCKLSIYQNILKLYLQFIYNFMY